MENFPPKPEKDLSQIDVSDILKMTKEFDSEFGHFPRFLINEGEEIANPDQGDEFSMKMKGSETEEKAEELLKKLGLEMELVKNGSAPVGQHTDNEKPFEFNELWFNLKDGKQFVKYLESLNPESLTESQAQGLREAVSQFSWGLMLNYNLDNPNDYRWLELIGNASKIIDEYKRLGIQSTQETGSCEYLEKALYYARKKCLKEFIVAKDVIEYSFKLYSHEYFPPAAFKPNWDSILNTLALIHQNENAKDVYQKSLANAQKAIDEAIVYFNNLPDDSKLPKKELILRANAIKTRLSEF